MAGLPYKLFFLFALVFFTVAQQNLTVNLSNCSNPIFSADSFKTRNQTRPRYLDSPAISELQNCKVFSNKSSCCNSQTDSDIKALFLKYKEVLGNLTSRKFRAIKKGFEDYSNIDFSTYSTGEKAKAKVAEVVQVIKNRLNQTTKEAVSCARQALKASAGLLCSGCNVNWGKFVKNGRLVLSKNSCLALSNACYGLLKDFGSLQTNAKADISNLTDAIIEFIGEDLPPGSEDFSLDIPSGRLLSSAVLSDFDKAAFCKKWTDSGVATSCTVCFIKEYESIERDQLTTDWAALSGCNENPIFKASLGFYKKYYNPPANTLESTLLYFGISYFSFMWTRSDFAVLPAVIRLKDGNTILPFISGNETMNNNLISLMKSKATVEVKNAHIENSVKRITATLEATVFLLRKGIEVFQNNQDFLRRLDNTHYVCSLRALDFVKNEIKLVPDFELKKGVRNYEIEVILKGEEAGYISESEYGGFDNLSKLSDFLKNCSKGQWLSKIENMIFRLYKEGYTTVCIKWRDESTQGTCALAELPTVQMTPPSKNKNQAVASFDSLRASGADPQRKSLGIGRVVPSKLDLPQEVIKVAEAAYTPPCDNVTHCAGWFCNNFLNGPYARVEKVLNPQNSADELDSEASAAYNHDLKRMLQDKSENELSDQGFNFLAVAESSNFDTAIAIDGVSEEAGGYDAGVKLNTTLDLNDFIPTNNTQGNNSTTNGTKGNGTNSGNGLVGKIENSFVILIMILLVFALF